MDGLQHQHGAEIEGSFDWSADGLDYEIQVGGLVTQVHDTESDLIDFVIAPKLWIVRVYSLNSQRDRMCMLHPREWPLGAVDLTSNQTLRERAENALIEQYVDARDHGCL